MRDRDETADDKSLVQIAGDEADKKKPEVPPVFAFWYGWGRLESEQEELRERIRPILLAQKSGLFPQEPSNWCTECDYLWTADCTKGQERVRLLEESGTGTARLGDIAHKSPHSETTDVIGERKQA